MARRDWTREELIVAFNLYCKTPFGRIHNRNPQIVELANAIGRTPSALSWKLANFARLDPTLRKRGIAGAHHGSRADIEVWEEFANNWERLAFESERLLRRIIKAPVRATLEMLKIPEGRTRESVVRTRVNQQFFREAVLTAYEGRCCVTGLSIPRLLNASHIVPWSADKKNRTNPRNGLCLNVIHDRAFDTGLMTITTDFTVKLAKQVNDYRNNPAARLFLVKYEGFAISLPKRFVPSADFLAYHNERVFLG